MAPIIRTEKLRKVYAVGKERVVALNNVDLSIEKGEFCCIVGQSGIGKSTLLNHLTGAGIPANNRLFATLDTPSRLLTVSDTQDVVISDTVGFIRNLPIELMDAFRATLEELEAADLLVHVADASHPDLLQQIAAVETILAEMELGRVPRLLVLS